MYKNDFSECIAAFEDDVTLRMRLGKTIYVQKDLEIFQESKTGELTLVTEDHHSKNPWIKDNFNRELKFQRRKKVAVCLSGSYIPKHEREEYKRKRGRGWTNAI